MVNTRLAGYAYLQQIRVHIGRDKTNAQEKAPSKDSANENGGPKPAIMTN